MLSPIFRKIGTSIRSDNPSICGIEAILGPFSNFTCIASSAGKGDSNSGLLFNSLGSLMFGKFTFVVRGSVITPVNADAAAVSGLHKYTLSSLVPRSEEHTSELQSRGHLVCRLLL